MSKKSWFLIAAALLAVIGMMVFITPAKSASWTAACTASVPGSERGLWFDTAGVGSGGNNNEAGLFWLVTNSSASERCTYTAEINPTISTNTYPKLRVRVAVNDGAIFKVQVYEFGVSEFCETLVATIATTRTEDNSQFMTKEITLLKGKNICAVAITLDDDPNDSPGTDYGRANALIDYIWIWSGSTYGWTESFAGGNP